MNAWQNNVNHSWRHCNFRNFCPWGGFVFFPTFGDFFGAAYYNWCWEINADQWFFGPHIQQPAGEFSARIHIILPDPNATVWWDDYRTTSTGTTRFCASSPMPLGTTYHFHLKVTWQDSEGTVTMERSVPVQAGAQRIVDFTKSSSLSK